MNKIPQLRIVALNYCGAKCIYCQPTGEGNAVSNERQTVSVDEVIRIASIYQENGGKEIKITGGDPVFWEELVECVKRLKNNLCFEKVEVITRSPRIVDIVDRLINVGLDVLNFSLDTLNREKYIQIVGCNNFEQYIKAIEECSKKPVYCKVNTVVMKGYNQDEIISLVKFCEDNAINQIKFLDIIDDLQDNSVSKRSNLHDMFISLDYICELMNEQACSSGIISQGGLGHPMNYYKLNSGLEVLVKNSNNGAWYGMECENCGFFPCHDALMAIRLCPNNTLQMCLLNETKNVIYTDDSRKQEFEKMLGVFENAHFHINNDGTIDAL